MQLLTTHLDNLRAQTTELLAKATDASLPAAHSRAALASCQLDASPLDRLPTDAEIAAAAAAVAAAGAEATDGGPHEGWIAAMTEDERNHAVLVTEYANVLRALRQRTIAADDSLLDAARRAHDDITVGLRPDGPGLRTTSQVLQDGNTGLVLYRPPEPEQLESHLEQLQSMPAVTPTTDALSAVEHAGVAHFSVLRVHPFEAANGRVARAVARNILHKSGLSAIDGCSFEHSMLSDRLAVPTQLAASIRAGDSDRLSALWLELIEHALATALYPDPPGELIKSMDTRVGSTFTVADWAATTATSRDVATHTLNRAVASGHVTRVLGSFGLKFRTRTNASNGHGTRTLA